MRVFVVDPTPAVRLRLVALTVDGGGHVVGEAEDLQTAIDLLPVLEPELVMVDARTPGGRLRDLVAVAKRQKPRPVVVSLASPAGHEVRHQCLAAGVDYLIDKADDVDTLAAILRLLGRRKVS